MGNFEGKFYGNVHGQAVGKFTHKLNGKWNNIGWRPGGSPFRVGDLASAYTARSEYPFEYTDYYQALRRISSIGITCIPFKHLVINTLDYI